MLILGLRLLMLKSSSVLHNNVMLLLSKVLTYRAPNPLSGHERRLPRCPAQIAWRDEFIWPKGSCHFGIRLTSYWLTTNGPAMGVA
jgi:hypothetical protein